MSYKILLIFAITALATATTLSLAICSNNVFAINQISSISPNTSFSSFALNANNSSIKNDNQNYSSNLKDTSQQQNNLLITKLLAKNLENHLQKAGAILEITSKLPQVRDLPFANKLNQTLNTLHGIPQNADIQKRQVANSITNSNSDLYEIFFITRDGDMYLLEPYSIQQSLTTNNYAFRDYFKGAIKTNDVYIGNVINTTSSYGNREAVIAVPVFSPKDNSTVVGVWAGGLDFGALNKELQSFNIASSDNNMRVIYTGHNGQKIADSDVNKSKMPESFANLQSFKNAINGKSGSIVDTVDDKKMMVTYQPVKVFHNTYAFLLIQPFDKNVNLRQQ